MIDAYKEGVPGNGKPFPDGSKIAKIEWKPKKLTDPPFSASTPDMVPGDLFVSRHRAYAEYFVIFEYAGRNGPMWVLPLAEELRRAALGHNFYLGVLLDN